VNFLSVSCSKALSFLYECARNNPQMFAGVLLLVTMNIRILYANNMNLEVVVDTRADFFPGDQLNEL